MLAAGIVTDAAPALASEESSAWSTPRMLSTSVVPSSPLAVAFVPQLEVFSNGNEVEQSIAGPLRPVRFGSRASTSVTSAAVGVSPGGSAVIAGRLQPAPAHAPGVVLAGRGASRLKVAARFPTDRVSDRPIGISAVINDREDAVVVFAVCREGGCRLRAMSRRGGARFGRSWAVGGATTVPYATVALSPNGHALVAYVDRRPHTGRSVIRWRQGVVGKRFSPGHALPAVPYRGLSPYPSLAATVSNGGRGTVAYSDVARPSLLVVSSRVRSDGRATRLRTVESSAIPSGSALPPTPRIRGLLERDGTSTLVWTGVASKRLAVKVLRLGGASSASVAGVVGSDVSLRDIATDGRGRAVLVATSVPSLDGTAHDERAQILVGARPSVHSDFRPLSEALDVPGGVAAVFAALDQAGRRLALTWASGGETGPTGGVMISERANPFDAG